MHVGADGFALEHAAQVAGHVHVEDVDGEVVFATHGGGRHVHHFQTAAQHFIVGDLVELRGGGVFFGIGGVDTVHARTFEHDVGFDLDAAERRTGVGGEVGVAGAGAHDHHFAAFEGFEGFPLRIELADGFHTDGGEHAVGHTLRTEGGGEGEAVDDRGAHAHLVAFHAVETFAGAAEAAEDVAAADDDAHLHAHFADLANLVGIFVETLGVDAVTLGTHEAFAAEFEENAFEFHI